MLEKAGTVLAEFICNTPESDVPEAARAEARRGLVNHLGVTLRGSQEEAAIIARRFALEHYGHGTATVLGCSQRSSAVGAAFVNGVAGHAAEFDDIGLDIGHPSAAVLPAALAAAEHVGARIADLVDAMVIGYEVASRIGGMYPRLSGPYARGYHGMSLYGIFGATAASARLLGLTVAQTTSALGIAASQSSGVRVNLGTMTNALHAGQCNSAGLAAALLARDGFSASESAIEGRNGWIEAVGGESEHLDGFLDGLGKTFAVERGLWIRGFPSCGGNHAAIEGVLGLMRQHGIESSDVAQVDVTASRQIIEDVLVFDWPRTGSEGQFSLAYNVAVAVVEQAVPHASFATDRIASYAHLRDSVVTHAADIAPNAANIEIRTKTGQSYALSQVGLHGSATDPLTWAEIEAKFRRDCGELVEAGQRDQVLDRVRSGVGTTAELLTCLVATAA